MAHGYPTLWQAILAVLTWTPTLFLYALTIGGLVAWEVKRRAGQEPDRTASTNEGD